MVWCRNPALRVDPPQGSDRLGEIMAIGTSRADRYQSGAVARALIAWVVIFVGTVVAAILVAGILLVVLKANPSNDIVKVVHDAAQFLAGPFDGFFNLT